MMNMMIGCNACRGSVKTILLLVMMLAMSGMVRGEGQAKTQVRLVPETNTLEFERVEDNATQKWSLPLYHKNDISYFSAGVGLEERDAEYPAFSLRCVFVQGNHPFLARIAVTIQDQKGKTVLEVPGEQVNGPWLFVDLPKGHYVVTATRPDGIQVKKNVVIGKGGERIVFFRWPVS